MEHSSGSKRQMFVLLPTDVGERVCTFLRRLYPDRTVDNVAADLAAWNIKTATIARMLERETAPGAVLWLALIWAYGPEFLTAAHPARLGWLDAASREQRKEALDRELARLRAERDSLE